MCLYSMNLDYSERGEKVSTLCRSTTLSIVGIESQLIKSLFLFLFMVGMEVIKYATYFFFSPPFYGEAHKKKIISNSFKAGGTEVQIWEFPR